MSAPKRTSTALALLIPAGVLGISSALAVVQNNALENTVTNGSVSERLHEIRQAVSATLHGHADRTVTGSDGAELMLAEWLNVGGGLGWHNGGWGNGGWHNGGWGNGGWHNAPNWGNGGWHNAPNWGNGWHNAPNWGNGGWHNFWHNW